MVLKEEGKEITDSGTVIIKSMTADYMTHRNNQGEFSDRDLLIMTNLQVNGVALIDNPKLEIQLQNIKLTSDEESELMHFWSRVGERVYSDLKKTFRE